MFMSKTIDYRNKTFSELRENLINYTKQYYPNTINNFNDASIGALLFDLMAGLGDDLSNNTDVAFQETQIDTMQEKRSIYAKAVTEGLKIRGKKPSVTLVDVTFNNIPAEIGIRKPDPQYCPYIERGLQVVGGGQSFETTEPIDFTSPVNERGITNIRTLYNESNGTYSVTKSVMVINGTTKIIKFTVPQTSVKPFYEFLLPETDVLSIESIIEMDGLISNQIPTKVDFYSDGENRWYEVDSLIDNKVFMKDTSKNSDVIGVENGVWKVVDKRFITEYTPSGYLKITFGGGQEQPVFNLDNKDLAKQIIDFTQNLSLGREITPNKTYYILYRTGGGLKTNLSSNTITKVNSVEVNVYGSNNTINNSIRKSLVIINPIPVVGGKDEPTIEEIRNLIKYNKSVNKCAVQIGDYKHLISTMPSKYGVPYKLNVYEDRNKIKIAISTLNENGNLNIQSTSVVKENIVEYLSEFRMINDYVEVSTAKVINIGVEVDIKINSRIPKNVVSAEIISEIKKLININTIDVGQNIMVGKIRGVIQNIPNVLNVSNLRIINKTSDKYSPNIPWQGLKNTVTNEINIGTDEVLYAEGDTIYEIKYPDVDIKINIK
jgi:hypothetical protein